MKQNWYLGFPCRVCDCEGASRFPWASSLVWGVKTRATGSLGCVCGWPSAVLSFVPPFAAPPLRGGGCQGWGAAPPGGLGLDTTEPPRSTLRKIQGGRKDRRGTGAGRADPLSVARGLPGLRRKPRAARLCRHTEQAGAAKPLTSRSKASGKAPSRGGRGVTGASGTGRAPRRRCLPPGPLGGSEVKQGAASV